MSPVEPVEQYLADGLKRSTTWEQEPEKEQLCRDRHRRHRHQRSARRRRGGHVGGTARVRLSTPHPATPSAVAATVGDVFEPDRRRWARRPHPSGRGAGRHGRDRRQYRPCLDRPRRRRLVFASDAPTGGSGERRRCRWARRVRFGAGRSIAGVSSPSSPWERASAAPFWSTGQLVPNTEFGRLPLHHGDAGELGRRIGPRARRALLEAIRPSASGLIWTSYSA